MRPVEEERILSRSPSALQTLIYQRDSGSGRVTIDSMGRPRLHYCASLSPPCLTPSTAVFRLIPVWIGDSRNSNSLGCTLAGSSYDCHIIW